MGHPVARLVLASGSPARRELLAAAGYTFDICPADIDEPTGEGITDIRGFVQEVAWRKAAAVAQRYEQGVVIAADSVGWIDRQVIGKPQDADDARRILTTLRGRRHELWTGVTLWRRPDNLQLCWQECSTVEFAPLTDDEIDRYLQTRKWQGCSGAYAVQVDADPYVRVVTGSVSNVIGLPMESLERALQILTAAPSLAR